jgi:hypothetical protein
MAGALRAIPPARGLNRDDRLAGMAEKRHTDCPLIMSPRVGLVKSNKARKHSCQFRRMYMRMIALVIAFVTGLIAPGYAQQAEIEAVKPHRSLARRLRNAHILSLGPGCLPRERLKLPFSVATK